MLFPKPTPRIKEPKPLAKVNRARQARQWKAAFGSTERVRWIHSTQGCVACGETADLQVHHVTTRGAGGGYADAVPTCKDCHREIHDGGQQTFERKWRVDLRYEARELEKRWREHQAKSGGAE